MKIGKQEFAWEFPKLSLLYQTRIRTLCELMRECITVSSTLMASQTRTRVAWEFPKLSLLYQTRIRTLCELMRECITVSSTLMTSQTRTRVCMRVS